MAYRIYLTDDDRFLLDLYAVKFKNAGHEVSIFGGGEDLLAELRKGGPAPDALLLDVVMPGMDGFTTLETIRKEKLAATSKVIILSNQGQDSDIERARTLGADSYIVKASAIPSEVLGETVRVIEGAAKTAVSATPAAATPAAPAPMAAPAAPVASVVPPAAPAPTPAPAPMPPVPPTPPTPPAAPPSAPPIS
jgi:DNA-binding response OmpR family regulator